MPAQLYVFETTLSNGTRAVGTAGLPYHDMLNLQTFYADVTSRIVEARANTDHLKVKTPVAPKSCPGRS